MTRAELKEKLTKFVTWARSVKSRPPGLIPLYPQDRELMNDIADWIEQTQASASARGKHGGGRPRIENPSPSALRSRKRRALLKKSDDSVS